MILDGSKNCFSNQKLKIAPVQVQIDLDLGYSYDMLPLGIKERRKIGYHEKGKQKFN
jgi:hypothetical protein